MATETGCVRCARAWADGHTSCPACGRAPGGLERSAGTDPLLGQLVGNRFRVLERLGEGGMGVVYRAEQQPIARLVALKVLHPHLAPDPSLKARFENEAAAASRLNHPCTITLYDFGTTDSGTLYIAMEFVDGRDLRRVLREQGPLEWRRTARIVAQIARSLDDAHAHGVVHRDLKPANVMVFDRGPERDQVKVLDFGVAKVLELDGDAEPLTHSGALLGTPQFLAPESIRGEAVDHRVDIYALGVMLYEALVGRPPFDGKTIGRLLNQHLNEMPLRPSRAATSWDAPLALEALTVAMLAKDPDDRPPLMREIAERLETAVRGPTPAPARSRIASDAPASVSAPAAITPPEIAAPVVSAVSAVSSAAPSLHELPTQPGSLARALSVTAPARSAPRAATLAVTPATPLPTASADEPALDGPALDAATPSSCTTPPPEIASEADAIPSRTAVTESRPGALDELFARMRANPDFPALAQIIGEINVQASRDNTSASELASVILKDVALASKVLRLVNSTYHGPAAGTISTVSHAIMLLGFDAVRDAALTLLLVNRSRGDEAGSDLSEIVLGALMRANVARGVAERIGGRALGERAYTCGLFSDLGRYLVAFYFPQEWAEAKRAAAERGSSPEDVAAQLLGAALPALGRAVAESWGFPSVVAESMDPLPAGAVARPRTTADQVRHAACFATELVSALTTSTAGDHDARVAALVGRFGGTLKVDARAVGSVLGGAVKLVEETARAARVAMPASSPVAAARTFLGAREPVEPQARAQHEAPTPDPSASDRTRILLRRLHEITRLLAGEFQLADVVTIIVETAFTGFAFENVFFAAIDPERREATLTHALGERWPAAIGSVRFSIADPDGDLFARALRDGQDVVIGNSGAREIAAFLPTWYRPYRARAFALYPVIVEGTPRGLFYVDGRAVAEEAAGGAADNRLGYMNRLRNTAALGFRKQLEAALRAHAVAPSRGAA
ncbi:MAG: HDOD domain-containing protein [bacterium]